MGKTPSKVVLAAAVHEMSTATIYIIPMATFFILKVFWEVIDAVAPTASYTCDLCINMQHSIFFVVWVMAFQFAESWGAEQPPKTVGKVEESSTLNSEWSRHTIRQQEELRSHLCKKAKSMQVCFGEA
jgi:hypothetical protein